MYGHIAKIRSIHNWNCAKYRRGSRSRAATNTKMRRAMRAATKQQLRKIDED